MHRDLRAEGPRAPERCIHDDTQWACIISHTSESRQVTGGLHVGACPLGCVRLNMMLRMGSSIRDSNAHAIRPRRVPSMFQKFTTALWRINKMNRFGLRCGLWQLSALASWEFVYLFQKAMLLEIMAEFLEGNAGDWSPMGSRTL